MTWTLPTAPISCPPTPLLTVLTQLPLQSLNIHPYSRPKVYELATFFWGDTFPYIFTYLITLPLGSYSNVTFSEMFTLYSLTLSFTLYSALYFSMELMHIKFCICLFVPLQECKFHRSRDFYFVYFVATCILSTQNSAMCVAALCRCTNKWMIYHSFQTLSFLERNESKEIDGHLMQYLLKEPNWKKQKSFYVIRKKERNI